MAHATRWTLDTPLRDLRTTEPRATARVSHGTANARSSARMSHWRLLLPLALVLGAGDAWALQPSKHRRIAEDACERVGLPDAFCRRVGRQALETDAHEWETPAAHAQRAPGEDRCSAADAAVSRIDLLARTIASAPYGDLEAAAIALGRAVHTVQDECAHHGMTNEEHSFYSLTDFCGDGDVSPDEQPAALACAESRTQEMFEAVVVALAATSWNGVDEMCRTYGPHDRYDMDSCSGGALPSPHKACEFLALHVDWDGIDSTWNGSVVGPALMRAFTAGLAGEATPPSVCSGESSAIDPLYPHTIVGERDAACHLAEILCLGKVDGSTSPEVTTDEGTGCSTGTAPGGLLCIVALLGMIRRRPSARGPRTKSRSAVAC